MTDWDTIDRVRQLLSERASALPVRSIRQKSLNRRSFVLGSSTAGLLYPRSTIGRQATPGASPVAIPGRSDNLFSLGVASGDPLPDGVVLWTRLVPMPFEDGGGMGAGSVDVKWEVAEDEQMTKIVQRGTEVAEADWAHSVHVEVTNLEPARWYWYRFRVGDIETTVGKTRTAPAADSSVDAFRFAFASCQKWDQGLYTAYRDMARQDVDLVVHLGDYIYESAMSGADTLRQGDYPISMLLEITALDDYRGRYALHKLDPDLQEAHRVAPWIVTWDDHEVNNNVFGAINWDDPAAQMLKERRAAAYQAYYEHQPLRAAARPKGPELQLYRRLAFGNLLNFDVLDTRQYRSPQGNLCEDDVRAENGGYCPDSLDPARTMLGDRQKQWLLDGFDQATTRWNVMAQQIPFARIDNDSSPERESFGGTEMDKWDGYAYEREQVATALASAAEARSFNPIFISGDVHSSYVWDLKLDWDDTSDTTVFGTEFVGTSISSKGDEPLAEDGGFTTQCGNRNENPHNHLFDNHRGYVLCNVSPREWQSVYRVMSNVSDQDATASTLTSFVVEHGKPGAQQDAACKNTGG